MIWGVNFTIKKNICATGIKFMRSKNHGFQLGDE